MSHWHLRLVIPLLRKPAKTGFWQRTRPVNRFFTRVKLHLLPEGRGMYQSSGQMPLAFL